MKGKKNILVMGVGRSGTTALYSLLQEILEDQFPAETDYVYEPFLWDRDVFNGKYEEVKQNFSLVSSLSIDGIYHNKHIPLFVNTDETISPHSREWFERVLTAREGKAHILGKMIRANGRLPLIRKQSPDTKIIFIIRNVVEVINSSLHLFSFFGDELYKSDYQRFFQECSTFFSKENEVKLNGDTSVCREADYWFYTNQAFISAYLNSPKNILLIDHESYVLNKASWISKICDFLELDFCKKYITVSERDVGPVFKGNSYLSENEYNYLKIRLDEYQCLANQAGIVLSEDLRVSLDKRFNQFTFLESSKQNKQFQTTLSLANRIERQEKVTQELNIALSIREQKINKHKNTIIEKEAFLKECNLELNNARNNHEALANKVTNFVSSKFIRHPIQKYSLYKEMLEYQRISKNEAVNPDKK